MQNLTIQLSFNFHHTESGLFEAIDLLEFTIYNGLAINSLRTYNHIFAALQLCRNNGTLSSDAFSRVMSRLVALHNDVFKLNGVR